jgi:hypothetical protein
MKNHINKFIVLLITASFYVSCDTNEDFDIPLVRVPFFTEDFQTAIDGTTFDISGWINFSEVGSRKWGEEAFGGNGYVEFSAFNSGSALNKSWLISPAINTDEYANEFVAFSVAQHHLDVDSPANGLEIFVSSDFDGTNVLTATWEKVITNNIPKKAAPWYKFYPNAIDISKYSGNIHVAFKFTGSGTDTTLDGAFQIDNFLIYNEK